MYELLRVKEFRSVTIAVARGRENVSLRRGAARARERRGGREKKLSGKNKTREIATCDSSSRGFRTCDPTQAQGAMSSPRSGPAKQNLQLAVASQNLHVISSSLAAASAASAASSTPVKDAVLLQQDLARPDGWSHSGKSSHSLACAARFLSAARVAPAPRNTAPRSIATRRARSRASGASVRGHRRRAAASSRESKARSKKARDASGESRSREKCVA